MSGRATWVSRVSKPLRHWHGYVRNPWERQIEDVSKLDPKNLILEIEEKLHRRDLNLIQGRLTGVALPMSNEYDFTADSDACDLNCKLQFAAALEDKQSIA